MITWPDLTFPPINLWNAPHQKVRTERMSKATPKPAKRHANASRLDTIRQLMARR